MGTWEEFTLSLSLAMCGNTSRGEGRGDIDRLKPLKLTNHRSIRHHHHHLDSRSFLSFLSANSLFPLSRSQPHTRRPPCLRQGGVASERAGERRGPPAPLVWSERSHDQQASTRSRTDWLTPQAQPRQKDPEGVNSTISELFHMTQQSGWQIKG